MKAKVGRGDGFRGALSYVLDAGKKATGEKKPEIVGGTVAAIDASGMSSEFAITRGLRPDAKRPVWHCSLSLPAGERLESDKWREVASDFMREMQFPDDTQWTVVRHNDTDYDHVHIIASRISLSGELWHGKWEARQAIQATQELERVHGLTLTAGLDSPQSADRKKITAQEINMGIREGKEPPRLYLGRVVDEALKTKPTAADFAEMLEAAGIGVRANIASTGRMNGFSFEVDGVSFKSSDIGKGYSWSGLQKQGLDYEQTRDSERLSRFAASAAGRGQHDGASIVDGRDEAGLGETTASNLERSSAGADAVPGIAERIEDSGSTLDAVQRDRASTASSTGRDERAVSEGRSGEDRPEGRGFEFSSGRVEQEPNQPEQQRESYLRSSEGRAADEREPGEFGVEVRATDRGINPGVAGRGSDMVEADAMAHGSGDGRKFSGGDWSSRFRASSAAKRRAATGSGVSVDDGQRNASREEGNRPDHRAHSTVDPTGYLLSQGFEVKKDGQRHLSVRLHGDELYRLTRRDDLGGKWLWTDLHRNHGGDNIALVQEIEPGTKFADAVYKLSGIEQRAPVQRPAPNRDGPRLPSFTNDNKAEGREYLAGRGISFDTIKEAESSGFLRYCGGGVLFTGMDAGGKVMNATRRATRPDDERQRKDLSGSDKRFPPILKGDSKHVWIVEGGADALALHDVAKRRDKQPPTVIVSGGAGVRSFLDTPEIQRMLKAANRVTIAGDNEKDAATAARTKVEHDKQAARVIEIVGSSDRVGQWAPKPEQGKDIAEMNQYEIGQIEAQQAAEFSAQQQQEQQTSRGVSRGRSRDDDQGYSL
jgi:hypothetical protein